MLVVDAAALLCNRGHWHCYKERERESGLGEGREKEERWVNSLCDTKPRSMPLSHCVCVARNCYTQKSVKTCACSCFARVDLLISFSVASLCPWRVRRRERGKKSYFLQLLATINFFLSVAPQSSRVSPMSGDKTPIIPAFKFKVTV